jgi:hypothetical protein
MHKRKGWMTNKDFQGGNMKALGMIILGGLILGTLYFNDVSGQLNSFEKGLDVNMKIKGSITRLNRDMNNLLNKSNNLKSVKVISERF